MHKNPGSWLFPLLAMIGLLVTGCNSATPSPTPVPPSPTPAPTSSPLPTDSLPVNRVPAIKNFSLVTGTIVKLAPDSAYPVRVQLTLDIVSTAPVESYPSFTDDKVGQEIDILIDSGLVGNAAVGDTVQVKVSYRGDESGGKFYGSELTLLPK